MTLDELVTAFYVDADSGGYLDQHATLLGLARKEGTRAFAVIRFTGRNGTIIPAGTVFLTPEDWNTPWSVRSRWRTARGKVI